MYMAWFGERLGGVVLYWESNPGLGVEGRVKHDIDRQQLLHHGKQGRARQVGTGAKQ
jgi:hypothetical protein